MKPPKPNFNNAMLTAKDLGGRARSFVDSHLTLGLTVGALVGLGLVLKFAWDEMPQAQEEIKRKKEVDPKATNVELAAAAAPYLKKTIIAAGVTGGVIIFHEYISNARLMAATAFGAAAFSDKKMLERKLQELTGKKKADEVRADMHNATITPPDATAKRMAEGTIEEGDDVEYTANENMQRKNDMLLNRVYKFELDWDGRVIYTTPMKIEGISKYIRENYGRSATTNWKSKPFSLETLGNLLGTNFADMGRRLGYPDGDDFMLSYAPAYSKDTGEMFFILVIPEPVADWELPFA
jgi:hypothetical protein